MDGEKKNQRHQRSDRDLGESLLEHLGLLREYGGRAFDDGDDRFLGEVAAKLRVLCYRQGRNRPLLLDMMERYNSTVEVVSNFPPEAGKRRKLEEYLEELALVVPGPNGRVTLTNKQLIGFWSQQRGGAHEDWEHSDEMVALRQQPVFIGGRHASAASLLSVFRTVMSAADAFLRELHAKGIIRSRNET